MEKHKGFLTKLGELVDEHRLEKQQQAVQIQPDHWAEGRLRRFLRWLMPNGGTLLLMIALIATARVWAKPLAGPAAAPGASATTVNYQGRLADNAGAPLDGTYGMSFSLWDTATDGNVVWGPESHTAVPVSEGLFSVGLGSNTTGGIPTSAWNGDRYLEITVGGETLSPRELIRSVPIAGMALTVPDGVIGTNQIADSAVASDQIVDGSVAGQDLAFKNVFYTQSFDHWAGDVYDPHVTATSWSYIAPTEHPVLILKPAGTKLYCRLITRVQAPSGGSIYTRWRNMGIEVTSNVASWTTKDSGWVDVSNTYVDGQIVMAHLEAKVTGGTGLIERSAVICAYGP